MAILLIKQSVSLYWICSASVHLLISTTARSKTFRNVMGVPEYLPGSIMEKLVNRYIMIDSYKHGVKKVEVIKATFAAEKPQNQKIEREVTDSVKATPVAEKKATAPPVSSGSEKPVSVLTNKPKKKSA
jgi:YidC/Oxa1 family membrane protein insertase